MGQVARGRVRKAFGAWDRTLFGHVAGRSWPAAEPVLPRLSRSADHGLLWFGFAAGMWAFGGPKGRRAAVRGVTSLALASVTVNTLAKSAVRRQRPLIDTVPLVRRLPHQPFTTSFPSGHSASAAAFTAGVALESPGWGAAVLPMAASVAFSRVYTGVHYPSDVLVGAGLGVGAAYAVRGLAPTRDLVATPARPRVELPARPDGDGLVVVVNPSSGAQSQLMDPVRQLRTLLPRAEVVLYEEKAGSLPEVLEVAAAEAAARGGVLGVCGGDGTVNAAVAPALRHRVPLLVVPGGTFNHFSVDLGTDTIAEACAALAEGHAVRADVGRITGESGEEPAYFLNTFSLGVYPELVRLRERWSPRIGGPVASLLGVAHVLRTSRPLRAVVNGRPTSMWLLFAGNGAYRSVGLAPLRRHDLADGMLDVRIARGGRFARTRLLATALAGGLARTRLHAAARPTSLRVTGLPEGTHMAYDGEVVPAPRSLRLDKLPEALTVYRPFTD
ncbi:MULTISPECIES: bifunctional phosphatase PAP2/diacylglycerol kinase family protein [Streptomyces]|uniref:bifunctional phosphatase PAP2/diacylglycerol kinase family protein n=1 Tax=Streptomyces TaxID=1883 RepID=UPI001317EB4B|nr:MULTISPECIES: bifunctional phosphatase PAP2/diacylglycerol kinase family protein [Streptomyces]QGZ52324.1 phosphatase PAP2 family protein [Streptomyces sp. QHH-9511]GGT86111.1 phosphoesterase [Streptomyces lateritius]